MSMQVIGTCRLTEHYEEDSDRSFVECLTHGWSASGAPWKIDQAIDRHYEDWNISNDIDP